MSVLLLTKMTYRQALKRAFYLYYANAGALIMKK